MGDQSPLLNEMIDRGLLLGGTAAISDDLELSLTDRIAEAQMGSFRVSQERSKALDGVWRHAARRALSWWDNVGASTERASKMAAYKYLRDNKTKLNLTDMQINNMMRRQLGTPILSAKGKLHPILSNLFFFYNPRLQGLLGDAAALSNPGVIFKRILYTCATKAFPLAMLAGLGGKDWQEWAKKIPLHHLLSRTIIPLGESAEGKAVYLTAPNDPVSAFIGSIFTNMALVMLDADHQVNDEAISSFLKIGYQEVPGVNPMMQTALGLFTFYFAGTGVPKDSLGRPIIPEYISDTGMFTPETTKALLKGVWNNFGGGVLYRFPYDPYKINVKQTPQTEKESVIRTIETALDMPLLQAFGSILQIEDSGRYQRHYQNEAARKREESRFRIAQKSMVADVVGEINRENIQPAAESLARLLDLGSMNEQQKEAVLAAPNYFAEQVKNISTQMKLGRQLSITLHLFESTPKSDVARKREYGKMLLEQLENSLPRGGLSQ